MGLIKRPASRGWLFFGGWGGSGDSASSSNKTGPVEGREKTLTDLWVEFLLKEASAADGDRRQLLGEGSRAADGEKEQGAETRQLEEVGEEQEREQEREKEKEKEVDNGYERRVGDKAALPESFEHRGVDINKDTGKNGP